MSEKEAKTQIVHIPSHADLAKSELLAVNRDKPRIRAWSKAMAAGVQWLEDLTFDLIVSKRLGTASGALLDEFGLVVGEQRLGLDDATYRQFIQARIRANRSSGTRDELIDIFRLITNADAVRYFDLPPAAFALVTYRSAAMGDLRVRRVRLFMDRVRPSGVSMTLIEAITDETFHYDAGPGYNVGTYSRYL